MAVPWAIIVPAVIALLSELLEKSPEKRAQEMQGTLGNLGLEPPFQSPYLPQMSEAAFKAAMSQMGRTQNWGWPAGKQMDTGWIQDMIGQIEPAIPAPAAGGVWNPTMGIQGTSNSTTGGSDANRESLLLSLISRMGRLG